MEQRRAAVLGKPIAHSLSPVIHNAGYVAAGLENWTYGSYEIGESELKPFVAGLGSEWAGLSLTMPLKEEALRVADSASGRARALGAANTLVRRPDGWRAENTDAPGMVDVLRWVGVERVRRVSVLGAGGTARAALAAAAELDAELTTVYARRAEALAGLRSVAEALGVTMRGADWSSADDAGDADVLISTVPRGVADSLVYTITWRVGAVLFDAVYDPWPTKIAVTARAAGLAVLSGLDLLLAQAVHQFELFTGTTAPLEAMRDALVADRSGSRRSAGS